MRYPEFLKENGKIGFVAPSFGAAIEPYYSRFNNAQKIFSNKGYTCVLGPNCYESSGIGKSNTPEKCAAEINDFFTSGNCDVIISCGGGETMCEDLPYIDFEAIKKAEPKWYMGYSDNTNLTFTLPTLCDTAAIYGPCAGTFGMETWHESVSDAFELLQGRKLQMNSYPLWELDDTDSENPLAPYNTTEPFAMRIYSPKDENRAAFSGRLIGGCLDCLEILCGTRFDKAAEFGEKYAEDGIIWFLEACDLAPMGIRRALWQLDNAGWFKNVKGFLIGRPMLMVADGMGLDRFTAVSGILEKYAVPILFDIDIGHLPPMMPIISGAMADIRAESNRLSIEYRLN